VEVALIFVQNGVTLDEGFGAGLNVETITPFTSPAS
jgi:hypothetical protein